MQKRNQLKASLAKSGGRAQAVLREMPVFVVHELVGVQGRHLVNQLIEQLVVKHIIDDDVGERPGRLILRCHLLGSSVDLNSVVRQSEDIDNLTVCHMGRRWDPVNRVPPFDASFLESSYCRGQTIGVGM